MLMEFETLDAFDVDLIMKDKWDAEEKKERVKQSVEAHRKNAASSSKGYKR